MLCYYDVTMGTQQAKFLKLVTREGIQFCFVVIIFMIRITPYAKCHCRKGGKQIQNVEFFKSNGSFPIYAVFCSNDHQ